MFIQVILYITTALVAFFVFRQRKSTKGKVIPGPTGLPILGIAHKINTKTVHDMFFELAKKHGSIFQINAVGENIVVLNDAELVRAIYCDERYKRLTSDRPRLFWTDRVSFNCKGIFATMDAFNSPHGELRKNLVRGMHVYGEGIAAFEETVQSELGKLNEQLENFNGKEFDMVTLIENVLFNFISILHSGQPIEDDGLREMFRDFNRCTDLLLNPVANSILSSIPALRFVPSAYKQAFDDNVRARDAILQKYVHEAKRTYQPGQIRGLVDIYLHEQSLSKKESVSDEQVFGMVLETIFGGVETTLSHLTSFFLCVMNHREYQAKIQAEIDRVIGPDRHPTVADKHACVFTEAVTLEVHRYITTAAIPPPRLCKPNIEFQGYDIPENSSLLTNSWFIHHDEKIWGDPWTFRPERWIGDDGALLPNDHVLRKNFLAFNTGRRACVGEGLARSRAFLFITTVLQRWSFEMTPEHAVSSDPRDGTMQFKLFCRPKPYLCRAIPRKTIQ